jgi:hypothetical protein
MDVRRHIELLSGSDTHVVWIATPKSVSCPAGVDRPFHASNHGLMDGPRFGEQETP